ncbi:MAG: hypothetical protein ABS54_10275 [Hyphomicrobium sp. SCN 65-11]|nr:MAG: hypothetical protein ABS54_10275 [Hyphomicrobium sp. SCN 65-11]
MLLRQVDPRHAAVLADFVRKVVASRTVWAVAGAEGLARLPSPTRRAREATIFWAEQEDAERAAEKVTTEPRVKPIPLADFMHEVLPKLRELERAVGTNWLAAPCEPEIEPTELLERLRQEILASFVRQAVGQGGLYILEDDQGPTFAASTEVPNTLILPVWTQREEAEIVQRGFWQDMDVSHIPVATFIERTLVWLGEIGRSVAPSYTPRVANIELAPGDIAERLKKLQRLQAHV